LLIVIDSYEDDNPREKMPCSLDDVKMTDRDGVEAAGIDRKLPSRFPPVGLNLGSPWLVR
jgi:hypothetical protein